MLGAVESGVDFEKRIAEIYQTCRTPEAIQASFDALQASLAGRISEDLHATRQKLLENFDAEVAEKLNIYRVETAAALNRHEFLLWELTTHMLDGKAEFHPADMTFTLPKGVPSVAPAGQYSLKPQETAHHYRPQHPLAQRIMREAADAATPFARLTFSLDKADKNFSAIRGLRGKNGILCVRRLTVQALEREDYILCAAVTETGESLTAVQARRLFDLPITREERPPSGKNAPALPTHLVELIGVDQSAVLESIAARNGSFFEQEMEKLDRWAEERKEMVEIQITEMDMAIRQTKADARKAAGLDDKIQIQRKVQVLEAKRAEMRKRFFEAQDAVDDKKDQLLNEIEARMRQRMEEEELFVVEWRLE